MQSAEVFESIVDWWSKDNSVSRIPFSALPSTRLKLKQVAAASPDAAFELVDVLVATAQNAVHMICESISCRLSGASEKVKKQAINPNLFVLLSFCISRPLTISQDRCRAVQVFGAIFMATRGTSCTSGLGPLPALVKDLVGSAREFKAPNFPALRSAVFFESQKVIKIFLYCFRCLGVLAEKVTQTTAVDDKRIRKELQVDEMLSSEHSHLPAMNPG